jgi:hypothetical protein
MLRARGLPAAGACAQGPLRQAKGSRSKRTREELDARRERTKGSRRLWMLSIAKIIRRSMRRKKGRSKPRSRRPGKSSGEAFSPYMKVDWHTRPDNIGHLYYAGCFRCHDAKHVSSDGRVISQDCDQCHTFLPGGSNGLPNMAGPSAFVHPIDLKAIRGMLCSTCHTGGACNARVG